MHMPRPKTLRRLGHLGFVALGALLLAAQPAAAVQAAEPKTATVRLVVDYGDGVEVHFTALPWREGMTALDALSAAKTHSHGVSFSQRGSGRSAMIIQIGSAKNEGGAADSKNWMYYLNDKAPEVGAGVQQLKPGDVVLWKFQVYDYNSSS